MAGPLDFDRVHAKGLVKVYGSTRALVGVNATFQAGRVTVVEGENGSGKSTLLNILAGLVKPTRGDVLYGAHPARELSRLALRAQIGVLSHAAMVYPDLTGLENLRLHGRLHGVASIDTRLSELAERFEIGRWGERPCRTYSRGQLQRVALARALVHDPKLLLLDEPSTGLDVRAAERLSDTVTAERKRGAILVLVTHDPALADRLGDDRVRLQRGRAVQSTSAEAGAYR